jgi:nanoRNase/pAp phosphatase (c-di-AMP/oligoRNAs hydrolase)
MDGEARPDVKAMEECLAQLLHAVGKEDSLLILPHNDPDPDAIASAIALRHLLAELQGLRVHVAYKGIIGRAENKALVRYLGRPLRRLTRSDLHHPTAIALVDTQPGAGNNALPARSTPAVVIDHHPWREATSAATFYDVRPQVGSTSAIMTKYLQTAGTKIPNPLATALFYGIKTDTLGLVRNANTADVDAYMDLQPQIDAEALGRIERAQVPADYFRQMDAALHAARLYDDVLISYIGLIRRPDLPAEMADTLSRLKGAQWVICMGVYRRELVLAVRTRNPRGGAGHLAQGLVGDHGMAGGHGTMAGGHVPLRGRDPEQVAHELGQRALQRLSIPAEVTGAHLMEPSSPQK